MHSIVADNGFTSKKKTGMIEFYSLPWCIIVSKMCPWHLKRKVGLKKGTNQTIVLDMTQRWTSSSGFFVVFFRLF